MKEAHPPLEAASRELHMTLLLMSRGVGGCVGVGVGVGQSLVLWPLPDAREAEKWDLYSQGLCAQGKIDNRGFSD